MSEGEIKMNLKRIALMFLVLALLVPSLAACSASAANTIKIGGLAPLTGSVSVYGIAATNGAKLAFAEINKAGGILGKKIDYTVLDEKGDVNEAINAYNKLADQTKVVAILGDVTSKPSISVAQQAAKVNMPMISATATALDVTKQGTNVFRACFIDPFQGKTMAAFAADSLKVTKVAIIYNSGDDYSVGLTDAFKAEAAARGLQVVASESYSPDDKDFKAQLTKIASASPEALFIPDYYNTVALIANQAKSIGLNVPLMGADGWDGVLTVAAPAEVEGAYFCNHYSSEDQDPKVQGFLTSYKTTYKTDANAFAALGYDAAYILAAAITKAGNTDSAAIVKALAETDYTGVTGNIKFDADRNPIKSVAITKIVDGKYTFFSKVTP
jgi:branched-chain amino acid transport system substrate-binding protein